MSAFFCCFFALLSALQGAPSARAQDRDAERISDSASTFPSLDGKAAEDVRKFCGSSPSLCLSAEGKLQAAREFVREVVRCADCGIEEIDRLNQERDTLLSVIQKLQANEASKGHLFGLIHLVDAADARLRTAAAGWISVAFSDLEETLTGLETEASALEALPAQDSAAALSRLRGLGEQGGRAYETFQGLSLKLDHAGWDADLDLIPHRGRANRVARRIAGMRDRVVSLHARLQESLPAGFDAASADASALAQVPQLKKKNIRLDLKKFGTLPQSAMDEKAFPANEGGKTASVESAEPGMFEMLEDERDEGSENAPGAAKNAGPKPSLSARTLLDLPSGAPPVPEKNAPRILKKDGTAEVALKAAGLLALKAVNPASTTPDWGELAWAALLRRMGASETLGNPGGWAELVHSQGNRGTCAIVAQQQVLEAYKLVQGSRKTVAEELTSDSLSKGYFTIDYSNPSKPPKDIGTERRYVGNLLQDRGLLVTKNLFAPVGALNKALSKGKAVVVSVDAGILWDNAAAAGSAHAILVTGVERSKLDGRILGYYINDSGMLSRGRFVASGQFLRAWKMHASSSFVEVQ
ncbi:MAG: hypothetical protein WCU88_02630 [Elusimicrobiota bacterium]|jgi:hypothetical protein